MKDLLKKNMELYCRKHPIYKENSTRDCFHLEIYMIFSYVSGLKIVFLVEYPWRVKQFK